MKVIRFRFARLVAVALAACSGSVASSQVVDQAGQDPLVSTVSHSDHGIVAAAVDQPHFNSKSFRIPRKYCGPTMNFQAEAMFLSRRYDVASADFGLGRASEVLIDSNWETGSGVDDNGDGEFESVEWDLVADSFAETAFEDGNFGRADQLTGMPRLTLGVVGEHGLGIQGRYWRMENSIGRYGLPVDFSGFTPYPSGSDLDEDWENGDLQRLAGFEQFSAETNDLELTKDFCVLGWSGLATFGVRHGSYNNYRINAVDGGIATGAAGLNSPDYFPNGPDPSSGIDDLYDTYHTAAYDLGSRQSASFRGTGLTSSLTALRPFAFNPELALFTSMRGSVLYGDSVNESQTYAAMDSFYNSDFDSVTDTIRSSNELYIAELQLGTQWSRNVRFLNGRMFARAAFEYQFWRNNAARASSESEVGDEGDTRPITELSGDAGGIGRTTGYAAARGLAQEFDLIGASFSAGFAF